MISELIIARNVYVRNVIYLQRWGRPIVAEKIILQGGARGCDDAIHREFGHTNYVERCACHIVE